MNLINRADVIRQSIFNPVIEKIEWQKTLIDLAKLRKMYVDEKNPEMQEEIDATMEHVRGIIDRIGMPALEIAKREIRELQDKILNLPSGEDGAEEVDRLTRMMDAFVDRYGIEP